MTRHEFLAALHALLQPKTYLEVGVQHGWSLQLSRAPLSIGVDPEPQVATPFGHHHIIKMTSDAFFSCEPEYSDILSELDLKRIDLAFIDGMHLVEHAIRDFNNIEPYCDCDSVVVFDDVLPNNDYEATREPHAGDWTGDVWRVYRYLVERTDLRLILVDTQPTGVLVVTNLDPSLADHWRRKMIYDVERDTDLYEYPVPSTVLARTHAWAPELVLAELGRRPR